MARKVVLRKGMRIERGRMASTRSRSSPINTALKLKAQRGSLGARLGRFA